jgi:hypothetical protein
MQPAASAVQKMRASAAAVSGENSVGRKGQVAGLLPNQLAGFVESANPEIVTAGLQPLYESQRFRLSKKTAKSL